MKSTPAVVWILRVADAGFVAAIAFLCWTLVWCAAPFERIGWSAAFALLAVPPLLLLAAMYFGGTAKGRPQAAAPLALIALLLTVSVIAAGTGGLQKLRWMHARPELAAIAEHPPQPGQTQRRQLGTYAATIYGNKDGTVQIGFKNSWGGLLYVPPGMPAPLRMKYAGREVLPHWFYYDMY